MKHKAIPIPLSGYKLGGIVPIKMVRLIKENGHAEGAMGK